MAEGPDPNDKALNELEKEKKTCPECRKDATLPSGGVEQLQSAFFVESMKDVYDKMEKVEGKVEAVCEQCSKGKSVAFCRQCADLICANPAILGEIESTCHLGETMQVNITTPTAQSTDIHAQLQSLADPASSVQADVVEKGAGVYHITYIPRVRGRHDLTVKVNGQDIAGSPFRVFVKIHPTQLGPPVRTITGVYWPWGIATNSKQQLVVAECGVEITIREQDGKTLQTIKNDKLQSLRGVATGLDGAIYVTDDGTHCLFKFNKDGRLLKIVQNEFQSPYFIKPINNRLYVSDYAKNVVKVLDTDCNVIGTIPTKECPELYDIAEGDDGLYVVGGGRRARSVSTHVLLMENSDVTSTSNHPLLHYSTLGVFVLIVVVIFLSLRVRVVYIV